MTRNTGVVDVDTAGVEAVPLKSIKVDDLAISFKS